MSETLKCPKCGSAILSDNGHVGFCQDDSCSNASGIDLAGYWQSRAVKAETALAVVRGITKEKIEEAIHYDYDTSIHVSETVNAIFKLINPDGKGEK